MNIFSSYELLWRSKKQVGVQIDQLPGTLQESLVTCRELRLRISLLLPPFRAFNEYLSIDVIIQHQLRFRTE